MVPDRQKVKWTKTISIYLAKEIKKTGFKVLIWTSGVKSQIATCKVLWKPELPSTETFSLAEGKKCNFQSRPESMN